MTESPPTPMPSDDADVTPDRGPTTGMPRWVKVFLIIVAALIALFVILNLAGIGGEHGPGRHIGPGGGGGPASTSGGTDHRPPPGVNHGG